MAETFKKVCTRCKQLEDHYVKSPSRCINCRKADKLTANLSEEERLARNKRQLERYHQNPVQARNTMLLYKYGITAEEYDVMLAQQGGVCAICKAPPTTRRLAVDHDHETGKIRGLLCSRCNPALGMLLDKIEHAQSLIEYLERGV